MKRWAAVFLITWVGLLYTPPGPDSSLDHHVAQTGAIVLLCTLAVYAAALVLTRVWASIGRPRG